MLKPAFDSLTLFVIFVGLMAVLAIVARLIRRQRLRTAGCYACRHFDHTGAQQRMHANAAFVRVMGVLSPRDHGKRASYVEEACPDCPPGENVACLTCCGQKQITRVEYEFANSLPSHAQWSDFGTCTHATNLESNGISWAYKPPCGGRLFKLRLGGRP